MGVSQKCPDGIFVKRPWHHSSRMESLPLEGKVAFAVPRKAKVG